jgi:hypothetical protein
MKKGRDIVISILAFFRKHPLAVVMVSLCFMFQLYNMKHGAIIDNDTESYQQAATLLSHGEIDAFRTPSYPLVLAICQQLTMSNGDLLVVLVQMVIFYLSLYCMYKTLLSLDVSKNIAIVVVFFYAMNLYSERLNLSILTESLAASFCVFMVGCFVNWLKHGRKVEVVNMLLCASFLLFLRPSFLYMIVAMVVIVVVLLMIRRFKKALQLTVVVVVLSGLMFGYCKIIESKIGVFTPSTVSIINTYKNLGYVGKLNPNNISDPEIKRRAINLDNLYACGGPYVEDLPPEQVFEEIRRMMHRDKLCYVKFLVVNAQYSAYSESGFYNIDFRTIYIFLIAVGCIVLYKFLRRKQYSMTAIFLWLMCAGNIMVDLIGSYAEWGRLFMPSVPLLLMLVALCCNQFKIRYRPIAMPI